MRKSGLESGPKDPQVHLSNCGSIWIPAIRCIWVNYNDLTATSLESWLVKYQPWEFFDTSRAAKWQHASPCSSTEAEDITADTTVTDRFQRVLLSWSRDAGPTSRRGVVWRTTWDTCEPKKIHTCIVIYRRINIIKIGEGETCTDTLFCVIISIYLYMWC